MFTYNLLGQHRVCVINIPLAKDIFTPCDSQETACLDIVMLLKIATNIESLWTIILCLLCYAGFLGAAGGGRIEPCWCEKVCQREDQWCQGEFSTALVEWNALHTILHGRDCVSHNASVEYKRPCSCYFSPDRGLLRMTHCYINCSSWKHSKMNGRVL